MRLHIRHKVPILLGALLVGSGIAVGAAGWAGFHSVLDYTSSETFCVSCHEMRANETEYQASVHYKNAAGVRATCSDCHVPRELGPKLVAKVEALNDVWHNLRGTIDTPEKLEARRLTLAKRVWARMQANDSRECRSCHSFDAMDFHKQKPEAAQKMQQAVKDKDTCISCHKGIAHKMPDMAQGIRLAYQEIEQTAAQEGARADTLYSIATKPMFVERPDGKSEGNGDARLLPLSQVKVLERQGDWLKVQIEGWQQEGAERVIYAMRGQRIFVAVFGNEAVSRIKQLSTETDPETEIVWHRASVDLWTGKDALIADKARLLAYGQELFTDSCGTCHAPPPTENQLANQWIGTLNGMKDRVSLDDEQFRFVQKYVQLNARDTKGKP